MNDPTCQPDPSVDALCLGPERSSRRLILLHGWGADADDLLDLGAALVDAEVSVVALRAPQMHPAGVGRQWYDLQQPQWPGLPAARADLSARIQALGATVPFENTALLGFSQGAAMALDVASELPLAALVACSGYPHPGWSPKPAVPILLTHGEQDPVVPFAASEALEEQVRKAGGTVRRVGFAGGHGIDPSVLELIREFLDAGWRAHDATAR